MAEGSGQDSIQSLSTADFDVEFYKLHRAHEVALNAATGAYEQSLLRLILIFNAASIGGFLSLIQAKDSNLTYNFYEALSAIYVWLLGITAAFLSTAFAYSSQRRFTQAFRLRRTALEMLKAPPAVAVIANWKVYGWDTKATPTAEACCDNANKYRASASRWQKVAIGFGLVAAVLSVVGFGLAIRSIEQRTSPQPVTVTPSK
jgi:hypothetical protein